MRRPTRIALALALGGSTLGLVPVAASATTGPYIPAADPVEPAADNGSATENYFVQLNPGEDPAFWGPYLLEEVGVDEVERSFNGECLTELKSCGPRIPWAYTELFPDAYGLWFKLTASEQIKMAELVGRAPALQGMDGGVVSIPDPIDVSGPVAGAGMNGAQVTPTGYARIGGESAAWDRGRLTNDAEENDVRVGILDTGLDARHDDLNVVGGFNCTFDGRGPEGWAVDVHGHGTHVGGTIGAEDNDLFTLGILPGVPLYGVAVLGMDGSGSWTSVACGLDVALRLELDVVNLSLGGMGFASLTDSWDVMHNAFSGAAAKGLIVVVAAGNDAFDAINQVPASYDDAVVTVSAIVDFDGLPGGVGVGLPGCGLGHPDDWLASFSNFGSVVDIAAPGGCILSTLPGNQMGYASGTSMATPHVTGVIAAHIAACGDTIPTITIETVDGEQHQLSDPRDVVGEVLRWSSDPEWVEGDGFWDGDRDAFKEPFLRYGAPCEEVQS